MPEHTTTIKELIEQNGLRAVLNEVAEACSATADHLEEVYGNTTACISIAMWRRHATLAATQAQDAFETWHR